MISAWAVRVAALVDTPGPELAVTVSTWVALDESASTAVYVVLSPVVVESTPTLESERDQE